MGHRGFRFGEWQIDPDGNTLSNGNAKAQLEPRAMDVLRYLCRHPGAVIPAEELLQSCWGSNELGDNPVHKAITQLRRALGDSSTDPRYIETIRKRGYRAIATVVAAEAADEGSWLQGSPFRGLEAFQENHAAIFFGRIQASARLGELVRKQTIDGCSMALVLGPSGSGKTSLVRAGLLPQLMEAQSSTSEPVALACTLYMDCADLSEGNLFQALAAVLIDAELDDKLLFSGDNAEELGRRLDSADGSAVIERVRIAARRPRIALFVDRLEAIFRAPGVTDDVRVRFINMLEQLARSGAMLVVMACRNDFYPEVMALPALLSLKTRGGHFDLSPPEGADIAQIVRLPARAAQLTFEQDKVTGASLDDVLCDAARGSRDTLPLLQYCLNELYRQRSDDGVLRFDVFQQLGGIEGAVAVRAEQVVTSLTPAQTAALPHVLSLLVDVAEEQGAITARRPAWSSLRNAEGRELVRALVEARLFVSELSGDVPSFGVAHEALLRRWPRVAEWIERHRHALQVRTRISKEAERWITAGRPRDLLLPRGSQVNQARGLLDMEGFSLSAQEQDYVRSSLHRVKLGERLRLMIFSLVTGLSILAGALGLTARSAQAEAEQHRTEAEGLMGYMLGEFVDKLRPLGKLDLLDGISSKALAYLSDTKTNVGSRAALLQRSKTLQVIAEVNIARGNPAKAIEALLAARTILKHQDDGESKDKILLKDLGANSFWLGQIYLGRNDWGGTEKYLSDYRIFSERLVSADPNDVDSWIELAYAHNSLGDVALKRGELERASQDFSRSVQLELQAQSKQPTRQSLGADLANSLSWLASTKVRLGLLDEAMKLYYKEEELLRPLHEKNVSNAAWTRRLAAALWRQGELTLALGQQRIANEKLISAEKLYQSLVKQDPSNRSWQTKLYSLQLKIIDADNENIDSKSTLAKLNNLHDQIVSLSKLDKKIIEPIQLIASAKQEEAKIHLKLGHVLTAQYSLNVTLALLEDLYASDQTNQFLSIDLALALLMQADIYQATGKSIEEKIACRKAQAIIDPMANLSSDFRLLVPQVRAYICTGERIKVATQINKLKKIAYRETRYLRYISHQPTQER